MPDYEFKLVIVQGKNMGEEFDLEREEVTVGRGRDNDIVLDDSLASRKHFKIEFENNEYILRDLGSRNGTIVNGERVEEKRLSLSDEIRIGKTTFKFVEKEGTFVVFPEEGVEGKGRVKPGKEQEPGRLSKILKKPLVKIALAILVFLFIVSLFMPKEPPSPPEEKEEEREQKVSEWRTDEHKIFPPDIERAKTVFKIGEKFFKEGEVSLGNYFRSLQEFKKVLGYTEQLFPKPGLYFKAKKNLKEAQNKISEKYKAYRFSLEQAIKFEEWERAERNAVLIQSLIPERNSEEYKYAKNKLRLITKHLPSGQL